MSIQSEINRLNAAKAELKTAIENGGVTVSLNAKIDAYPALVDAITQQIKDKVDAINGEVVEGDVDAKLNKITSTKAAMKSAINGSGSTVGDVFSAYPAAITSGKSAIAQAVTDKGVETAATDTFAQMAANINEIETGGDVASIEIDKSGDGIAQVYDCEKRQWVDLSSTYATVKVSNFVIIHKGKDLYSTSNIVDESGQVNFSDAYGSGVYYLIISQIDYPKGFSGLKNTKVTLYYNRV